MKETRTRSRGGSAFHPKPVERIELSSNHLWLRGVLTVLFLIVGASFLAYGVSQLSAKSEGWTEVEVTASQLSCESDFVFRYCLGEGDKSATAEYKALTECYSEAVIRAFQLFTVDVEYEDICNLYAINRHPNQELTVDNALYQAFSRIQHSGDRRLYLAPVYEQYRGLFSCTEEYQTAEYDPRQNPSIERYYKAVAAYANDPEEVDLELLGENRICLKVSEKYLAFAEENEIESFIDFDWMKNAFIIDYLADTLTESGFTHGYLTSYDGFTRHMDTRAQTYPFQIYGRNGSAVYPSAQMELTSPVSIVALRNYPLTGKDSWHYYTYASGDIATAFLDPADGVSKSAADDLISYSADLGCAEILLQTAPIFIAEELRTEALSSLAEKGIYSLWNEGAALKYNEPGRNLVLLPEGQYTDSLE